VNAGLLDMAAYYPPRHPVIGILGGMGPAATIDLMRRVMEATPASDDADHIHLLVDQNPKVPSRIDALINRTGPSPADELARMAQGLEAQGATTLAIACNTAHGYADEIARAVAIPLLDMVQLTAEAVAHREPRAGNVGMLASTAVLDLGLYEKAFKDFNIKTRYPEQQAEVLRIIRDVKAHGATGRLRREFNNAARAFAGRDVDLIVIACTELSLLTDGLDSNIPVIDALDVLVKAIVACGSAPLG
jgi:aspartate racemase